MSGIENPDIRVAEEYYAQDPAVTARLGQVWKRQGRRLQSLGYSVGQWSENINHRNTCDCDEDEETAGPNCMANSVWCWALFRDGGGFTDRFVMALSGPRTGTKPGRVVEPVGCTGLTATWCPLHGDCDCPLTGPDGSRSFQDPDCPLHGLDSLHAQ